MYREQLNRISDRIDTIVDIAIDEHKATKFSLWFHGIAISLISITAALVFHEVRASRKMINTINNKLNHRIISEPPEESPRITVVPMIQHPEPEPEPESLLMKAHRKKRESDASSR